MSAEEFILMPNAAENLTFRKINCGNSSVGRAQPCQGWGREFEPRFPLKKAAIEIWLLFLLLRYTVIFWLFGKKKKKS